MVANLKKIFLCVIILLIFSQISAAANKKNAVNVLTWWNYLNYPEVSEVVKKECGVDLHYDEYFSISEFLRRFNAHKDSYDVIIFSNTIYKLLEDKIKRKDSDLYKVSDQYDRCVKNHYLSNKYAANVVVFVLSFPGFLWNPKVMDLSKDDTIFSIFKKAKDNVVVLIDDPVEVWALINQKVNQEVLRNNFPSLKKYSEAVPLGSLKKLIQSAVIYVADGYNKLYDKDNFAVAFQWSGEVVYILKKMKKELKFILPPTLSYISSDMLAELNTRPATRCVAKTLASKKVLDIIQEKTYYLSPYGTYKSVTDPAFRYVYDQLDRNMCKLKWLESISPDGYKGLVHEWREIQLSTPVK